MFKIIKNNPIYFLGILLFIIIGGLLLTQIQQGDAILFFSDRRQPFWDVFFMWFTKMAEEIPYIFFFIFFLFVRFRYSLLIILTVITSLILSLSAKAYFAHPRPISYFKKLGMVDEINFVSDVYVNAGNTSFPSGHTLSAFTLYGLLAFIFYKKQHLGVLFFFFALGVGISRIYLVQHFLKDVYLGAILGTLLALTLYYFQSRIAFQPNRWFDKSLRILKNKNRV